MSTVGTISRIAASVAGRTVDAVTHPVRTVGSAAGRARHLTGSVIGGSRSVIGSSRAVIGGSRPVGTDSREPAPGHAPAEEFPEAPTPRTVRAQEPSTTEPKAASRSAAHTGRSDEPTDDWHDELDDGPDAETQAGTTGVAPGINPATGEPNRPQPDTEPLLDPSLTKKTKAEAEMMRQASDAPPKKG